MKFFTTVIVVLALIMGAQSSIIAGLGVNGLGAAGPLLAQGPIVIGWGASVPIGSVAAAIPVNGATYIAKTRGAIHTAPLPGHTLSATSVNVDPAPGTW